MKSEIFVDLPKVDLDLITNRHSKWSSSKAETETEFSAGHYSPKEGDEIILHCKVKSNPLVNKVNWYKNDILLHSNSTKGEMNCDLDCDFDLDLGNSSSSPLFLSLSLFSFPSLP